MKLTCKESLSDCLHGECSGELKARSNPEFGIILLPLCDLHYQQQLKIAAMIQKGYVFEEVADMDDEERDTKIISEKFIPVKTETEKLREELETLKQTVTDLSKVR